MLQRRRRRLRPPPAAPREQEAGPRPGEGTDLDGENVRVKLPDQFGPFALVVMLYWLAVCPMLAAFITRFVTKGSWPEMNGGWFVGWFFGGVFFTTSLWLTRSRRQRTPERPG